MTVHKLTKTSYGQSLSTVFGSKTSQSSTHDYDDDDDPILRDIRFLDYRYIRFCFHPFRDKFLLCSDWTDPAWTNVTAMRTGLDSEERYTREQVFDKNQINIQEKSTSQLLVDEVNNIQHTSSRQLIVL